MRQKKLQFHLKVKKNSKDDVFGSKQRKKKLPPRIFRGFQVRTKVRLMFWKRKNSMKKKNYVFSAYKQRNMVCLVFLECKLQQRRYGWCIFNLKFWKIVESTYLERTKQKTRYKWCLLMLKLLQKGTNIIIGPFQQTKKLQCMYLAFKNIKISSTIVQQYLEK